MPVRVKHRAVAFQGQGEKNREWENLKKNIVALLLACGQSITVIARDAEGNGKFVIRGTASSALEPAIKSNGVVLGRSCSFSLSHVRSILSQAAYICSSGRGSWVSASARTPSITIRGVFSLEPAPSKHVQFISIGIRPIYIEGGVNELYDSVNRIFASSSFGALEDGSEAESLERQRSAKDRRLKRSEPINRQLKGGGKGVDRWPMFYLRIDLHNSAESSSTPEDGIFENERSLKGIVDVLGEMTRHFLKEHHFQPRARTSKRRADTISRGSGSSTHSEPIVHPVKSSDRGPTLTSNSAAVIGSPLVKDPMPPLPRRPWSPCAAVADNEHNRGRTSGHQGGFPSDHVQIPSFAKGQQHGLSQGLNGWSRVKAGNRDVIDDVCAGLPNSKVRKELMQAPSGSLTECGPMETKVGRLSTIDTVEAPRSPAVECSEADLLRDLRTTPSLVPSESLETRQPHGFAEDSSQAPRMEKEDRAPTDEVLLWTNPISKATVLIDSRTGIVVPQRPYRPRTAPTATQSLITPAQSRSRWSGRFSALRRSNTDSWNSPKAGSWIGNFLESWDNPVFRQTEEAIPQITTDASNSEAGNSLHGLEHHCLRLDTDKVFEQPSNLSGKLSREGLKNAEVVAQVDKKFILVKMGVKSHSPASEDGDHNDRQLLVLIDQHAADERCRIEGLLAELCRAPSTDASVSSDLGYTSQILSTSLSKHITFQVPPYEQRLFRLHAGHFAKWGILYDIFGGPEQPPLHGSEGEHRVVIKSLPPGIVERCKVEKKHLIELLRGEVWKREEKGSVRWTTSAKASPRTSQPVETPKSDEGEDGSIAEHSWLSRIGDCPRGILDMLNSRSCRSAIMFNDQLSREECQTLVSRLAKCAFPFQCAHGRPCMIPLVDLGTDGRQQLARAVPSAFGQQSTRREEEQPGFVEAFGRWKGVYNHDGENLGE